jgi:putative ABC transport system ATP-binding protein
MHNLEIASMADWVIRLGDGRVLGVERNKRELTPSQLSW